MPDRDAHLSIRIDLPNGRIGPGKAALLRAVDETGSISAAARSFGMSYVKAWRLIEDMNSIFHERVVDTYAGGNQRGGAALTPTGRKVVEIYDQIDKVAERAVRKQLAILHALGV